MKKIAILIILLLLPAVTAQTLEEIANAKEVTIDATISSSFEISKKGGNYNLDYINAQLFFFPKKEYNQDILSSDFEPEPVQEKDVIIFNWGELSPQKVHYSMRATVLVKNDFPKVKQKIPYPISVSDDLLDYLQPTGVVDSRHPLVIEQATRLAEGENDLFILVSKIASWTKNTIDYNLSTLTAEIAQPASWVLQNRKGVCDELTSLFIAMLRALGIPAKFASGLSFTNSPLFPNQWGAHGWAEVYFPDVGWIPFDPTFGEFGWIDPGHIKMRDSLDPKEPSTKFEWKGKDIDIDIKPLDLQGEIKKIGEPIEPILLLTATGAKDDVGVGTYNLAVLNITNLQDYYVATEIVMALVEEIDILEDPKKQVVLKPKETKQLLWRVKVHDDLKEGYRYEIPLGFFTIRNESSIGYFTVLDQAPKYSLRDIEKLEATLQVEEEKVLTKELLLECNPEKQSFFQDEENKIICDIRNTGNIALQNLKVCFEDNCKTIQLLINQQTEVVFPLEYNKPGEWDYLITATTDEISQKDTVKVTMNDKPVIEITELNYPETVKYEETFELRVAIEKTSISKPEKVRTLIEEKKVLHEFKLDELAGVQEYVISLQGKQLTQKETDFTVKVLYEDSKGTQFETKQTFTIKLEKLSFFQSIEYFFRKIFSPFFR